ncbi:hypothetical protein SAMN04487987_110125 [Algibacter pectinivorans]|uniref:Uncharacterized protein n=1 Tax=Algibacter pectinivorans TaxID=870482 RepID=A0A1I1RN52_9FLAO|nr:hypothetical protein SAMN04487987_110125 [Algibacter pectinivorans]
MTLTAIIVFFLAAIYFLIYIKYSAKASSIKLLKKKSLSEKENIISRTKSCVTAVLLPDELFFPN